MGNSYEEVYQDGQKTFNKFAKFGRIYLFILLFGLIYSIIFNNNNEPETKANTTPTKPTNIVQSTLTPEPTPVPTLPPNVRTEEEYEEYYKNSCKEFKYKDVLRNPENYVGERVVVTIQISTVHSEDIFTPTKYYMGYSEGDYGFYGDRYGIFDHRYDKELKLLSDDVIKVWGEISEPKETQSLIVASEELFCIDMKYVELISE